jgi:hypothetical protein
MSEVRFSLIRFRSPLLTKFLLVYFPRGTEMFYFPRYASLACARDHHSSCDRVSPFGHLRIKGCSAPPRSVSSPRHVLHRLLLAKASTIRPWFPIRKSVHRLHWFYKARIGEQYRTSIIYYLHYLDLLYSTRNIINHPLYILYYKIIAVLSRYGSAYAKQ